MYLWSKKMLDKFNDDNKAVLLKMSESGDDLSKKRDIDFSVVFHSESNARDFCRIISENGWRIDCYHDDENPDSWDVTITSHMAPTPEGISAVEEKLARSAAPFAGEIDGWGCFPVAE
jgi:hypothetical protein